MVHTMANSHPPARLQELDALRGIAACIVMLFHYTWQISHVLPHVEAPSWGIPFGKYGVELFFGISGFVIFMTLERTKSAADFIVSRFGRLFPAYWAGIALTTLIVTLLPEPLLQHTAQTVGINLSMAQGFLYLPSVDGVYWSLTVELAFYACMLGLWKIKQLHRIEVILIAWMSLKILWWWWPDLPSRVKMVLLAEYIPYFALGIAAYRVRAGERRWVEQVPLLGMGLLTSIVVDPLESTAVYVLVTAIFWALTAGLLGWLVARPLIWLGAISYPLYLVHQNIGYAVIDYAERAGVHVWPAIALAIGLSLALAHAIHIYVEGPTLDLIRNWWRRRKLVSAPA